MRDVVRKPQKTKGLIASIHIKSQFISELEKSIEDSNYKNIKPIKVKYII